MMKAELEAGDAVEIVRGTHKKNKHGTHRGPWGSVMARVKVEGDSRGERHPLLTSIKKTQPKTSTQQDTKTFTATATVTIEKKELEELRKELMPLKITVRGMEDKINSLLS